MKRSKGKIFFSAIGYILKALWKLLLLAIYATAKVVETFAGFIAKLTEKVLN